MEFFFDGSSLRLARVFCGLSLEEVSERVGKTRQYLHKLETGQSKPTDQLMTDLADSLDVEVDFFMPKSNRLSEDQFHFRKLFTTKSSMKQVAVARGEMVYRLICFLDKELKLPKINIPSIPGIQSYDSIERASDICRKEWGLGSSPIGSMTRLAESLGTIVTNLNGVSAEIDALSVAVERPFIVRNTAKESVCRQRFDIAHELGHLVMHEGIVTGDRTTESQANRFASALLLPRAMMIKLFPRPNGERLDWKGMREFKQTWKVSKAAILYRAKQLELITEAQYKRGVITLKKHGESHGEKDDYLIPKEPPEVLQKSLNILLERKGIDLNKIAAELLVKPKFIRELTGLDFPVLRETPKLRLVQ
ncbi:helix-turn-helix domain-containing protein [Salinicola peritrichatus]|uniref:helix-turn-helix domain-containing protein n=1 Tax=Salinicola peritrichatus TaxID=1267424 RepID=UPI000DA2556A|nr:XRE family transcriptional regulator [Salinicola peritrichatus]